MCLSLTALDTRDGVCMYSSIKLLDAHCDTVYQVADLHTSDWTNKGLWVTPHQVSVGEPGEDHTQGWGAWYCKGWQRMGWREHADRQSGRQVFSCEISLLADAVVAVSSAAWLSGAVPCSLMARTSKL